MIKDHFLDISTQIESDMNMKVVQVHIFTTECINICIFHLFQFEEASNEGESVRQHCVKKFCESSCTSNFDVFQYFAGFLLC